jgi:hypothetical protein
VIAPFAVATTRETLHHWVAISDDAAIAMRSWDSFGPRAQLVGQFSQVPITAAHAVYDPGPLEYWLLAVPVHADPRYGLLWGAAFWCVVAAMITVEAVRSIAGSAGGLAAAGVVVGNVAWMPQILLDPAWNPHLGEMFFLAAVATTWAVLCGHRGWLPVAVLAASIATQMHLMFALASIACALLALVWAGIETHRARSRQLWLLGALAVGIACWIGPIIQELTSHPGNLTLLLHSQHGQARIGPAFGMRFLAAATFPHPMWWQPSAALSFIPVIADVDRGTPAVAVIVAGGAVLLAAVSFRLNERRLGALAIVSLILSLALTATFANLPPSRALTVVYLDTIAFPIGIVAWVTAAWAVVFAGTRLSKRKTVAQPSQQPRRQTAIAAVTALLLSGGVALSVLAQTQLAESFPTVPPWSSMRTTVAATRLIEKSYQRGTFEIAVNTPEGSLDNYYDILGVAWALRAAGWNPLLAGALEDAAGADYGATPVTPVLVVSVSAGGGISVNELKPLE